VNLRLTAAAGCVFRGINSDKASSVLTKYVQGLSIHLSAFSSTTPSFAVAVGFAGDGGVILRYDLIPRNSKARDITEHQRSQLRRRCCS